MENARMITSRSQRMVLTMRGCDYTGEKQEAERDSEKRCEDEPAGAEQVNVFPVLDDDDGGDGDRHQHGERGGESCSGMTKASSGTATSASPKPNAERISVARKMMAKTCKVVALIGISRRKGNRQRQDIQVFCPGENDGAASAFLCLRRWGLGAVPASSITCGIGGARCR